MKYAILGSRPPRCAAHKLEDSRVRGHKGYEKPEYKRMRAAFIDNHVKQHGLVCPGLAEYDHPSHPVAKRADLTVDHIRPLSRGGSLMDLKNWRCLCRSMNSGRGAGRGEDLPDPPGDSGRSFFVI